MNENREKVERAEELLRAIDVAHESGDKGTLEHLQDRFRSGGFPVTRMGASIELVGGSTRLREPSGSRRANQDATPTKLYLSWPAYESLCDPEYTRFSDRDENSLGGFGAIAGDTLAIDSVKANVYVRPYSRDATLLDWRLMAEHDTPEHRLVAWVHNHPSGDRNASRADLDAWQAAARDLGHVFAGIVVTASEIWFQGYPDADWQHPLLTGWIATPAGDVREVPVTVQEKWMYDARRQVRFARDEEED